MKRRGADLLAQTLAAAGVRKLFALSGNHVMPVFDAALHSTHTRPTILPPSTCV